MRLLDSKKNYVSSLILVGACLFLLGYYFKRTDQLDFYRITRGITSFSFLTYVLLIHKGRSSSLISYYLLLCGIIGLFGLWFEQANFRILIIVLSAISIIVLAVYLSPKIKKKPLSPRFLILTGLLTVLNAFLLYHFIEMILVDEEMKGVFSVMILYALLVVFISLLVLVYNKIKSSRASMVFTMSWFALVVSEILRAAGYYEVGFDEVLVHTGQILFIVSNALLVYYTIVNESEKPSIVKYV
ncbi:MAG: hypothetical protein ACI9KI_001840 [Patiriisocius sp.]